MRKVTDESLGTVHTSILLEKRNTKDSKKREEDKRNNLSSLSCHTNAVNLRKVIKSI